MSESSDASSGVSAFRDQFLKGLQLCRFCLSTEETSYWNIFEDSNFQAKASEATATGVRTDDGLSQVCCLGCKDFIEAIIIFRRNCLIAYLKQTGISISKLQMPELYIKSDDERDDVLDESFEEDSEMNGESKTQTIVSLQSAADNEEIPKKSG